MMFALERISNIFNFFDNCFRGNAVFSVMSYLDSSTARGLIQGSFHRVSHRVGIEDDPTRNISGRSTDDLNEGSIAPQETFFIGVHNSDRSEEHTSELH